MQKILGVLFILVVQISSVFAQCAMCKANAERSLAEGSLDAAAINMGILYLLAIPFILIGGVLFVLYRARKQKLAV